MTDQQLELGFGAVKFLVQPTRRQRRITHAAWWFDHMRQIVDRAMDWNAPNAGRPEQIWLPEGYREVSV